MKNNMLRVFTLVIATLIVVTGMAVSTASAQTDKPSTVAYNYHRARKHHRRGSVRGHRAHAPAPEVSETEEAKFVVTDDKYEVSLKPGDSLDFAAKVVKKSDSSESGIKLLRDYTNLKSNVLAGVKLADDKMSIQATTLFPGKFSIPFTADSFNGLRKTLVVTVEKVDIKALDADSTDVELNDSAKETNVEIDANDGAAQNPTSYNARLKAVSDNKNVLISFPNNDPMAMTITAKNIPTTNDITANITVTSVDFPTLKITIKVTIKANASGDSSSNSTGNNNGNSNPPAPSSSPSPAPQASPKATPKV